MGFDVRLATINTQMREFAKSVTEPSISPKFTEILRLFYREIVVLGVSFVDQTGTAVSFNADDTFELSVDHDFVHTVDPGVLDSALSGATISIPVTYLVDPDVLDATGTVVLLNDNLETEHVPYTAVAGTGFSRTFTVSKTLDYEYEAGDIAGIQDKLMVNANDAQVDIAGDWADIDRATGKVSFRVDCSSIVFLDKLEEEGLDANSELLVNFEIKRYLSGEEIPVVLCQDTVYARNIVKDLEV